MKYCVLNSEKEKSQFSMDMGEFSPFDIGVPLFDCADETIREIYYYRWNLYCRHIRKTPEGHIVTEFYPPVPWAKKYNTINCPAGHHLYEGRWLHNKHQLNDYIRFWFCDPDADPRHYSFWAADAVYNACCVSGDFTIAKELYDALKENYAAWEKTNLTDSGLFYQIDNNDGMEYSISGNGLRPTINSYMYGDAVALSKLAARFGSAEDEKLYADKAKTLKALVDTMLWDEDARFYKTLSESRQYTLADVREQIGYIPWYFNLPDADKSDAWKFLNDKDYFAAPYGPTTAEQNHPDFMKWFDHECLWNGPSWPYATAQTLTALGNLLCNYTQTVMTKHDYYSLLHTYANSHYDTLPDGKRVPYIDENLDPYTGEWIARRILREMENPPGGAERGEHYNHSSFCDLVLNGLVGVRADEGSVLNIQPLFEETDLVYMCADGILYHGHSVTVLWDKTGERYGKGKGFVVFVDGVKVFESETLCRAEIDLK